jgi:hypothetical protein
MKWNVIRYGFTYFALVFAAGFVLGTIRVLLVEPRIGARYAELIEIPVMLIVIYQTAKFVVSRMPDAKSGISYFVTGAVALALLLLFEIALVLGLQGMTLGQYLESRDEISFSVYLASLIIFMIMPWLVRARGNDQ